jgi:hypothetical protein
MSGKVRRCRMELAELTEVSSSLHLPTAESGVSDPEGRNWLNERGSTSSNCGLCTMKCRAQVRGNYIGLYVFELYRSVQILSWTITHVADSKTQPASTWFSAISDQACTAPWVRFCCGDQALTAPLIYEACRRAYICRAYTGFCIELTADRIYSIWEAESTSRKLWFVSRTNSNANQNNGCMTHSPASYCVVTQAGALW